MEIKISEQLSINASKFSRDDYLLEVSPGVYRSANTRQAILDIILSVVRKCITAGHEFSGYENPKGGVVSLCDGGRYIDIPGNISRVTTPIVNKITKMPVDRAEK